MPDNRRVIYWDACVFLSYINEVPNRIGVLDALLASSASDNGTVKIYTSAITRVEVSFAAPERAGQTLDPQTEQLIDNLWADPDAIVTVEYHDGIGIEARRLMREGLQHGWSLKPLDAIHLATAQWLSSVGIEVDEFHTYDSQLRRYAAIIGVKIIEPYTPQPNLF